MISFLRYSIAAFATLAATAPALGGLIQNPSFETPSVSPSQLFFNGQTIGAGWEVLSGNTAYIITDDAGQGTTPFGRQFLEVHFDTVGQTLSGLSVGSSYVLSYYATAQSNANYFGAGNITANVGGVTDVFSYSLTGNNPYGTALPWTHRELTFVATAPSELLTFSGSGAMNFRPLGAFDNVSIAAVPEPKSYFSFVLLLVPRRFRPRGKSHRVAVVTSDRLIRTFS